MSNRTTTSFIDVLAQRLYRGVFRSYSLFFASMPVSLWYRNSLRLNYLTPFLSDIDVTFDCGDLNDLDVYQIQRRHNFVRRLFLRVGEANFYVHRHQDFIKKYANPLELARDPDLLQKYDLLRKTNSLLEAQKFAFAVRSLNSDRKNLRQRPHWRQAKWNFHLQSLGFNERLSPFSRSSLVEFLDQKLFSVHSSRSYGPLLKALLENPQDLPISSWLSDKDSSATFFLLAPVQWMTAVAKQADFKRCLPHLTALSPFEQQVAFSHITWEIASLLTQFTWVQDPIQYSLHMKRLMQVCRFACPYYYEELLTDFLKLEHSSGVDLFRNLEAATISATYCKQAFANIDIDTKGVLRFCERDEDLKDLPDLRSFTLFELTNRPERLALQKAMFNGQKHPHCERCYKDEELTGVSPRILSNHQLHSEIPTQARLKLGKNCELTCFKCSAGASSSWEKFFGTPESSNSLTWYLKPAFWKDFEEILPGLSKINLSGGDALSFEGHAEFLQRIIASNNAAHLELIYHTNGQRDIRPYFDLWKSFKKVHVVIVLDGIQERNDYLRPPSLWNQVQANIQILDDSPEFIEGSISFAIHGLNAFYLLNDLRWLRSQTFKKLNSSLNPVSLLMPQYTKDFRSLQACPVRLKQAIEEKLKIAIAENLVPREEILSLIGFMNSEDTFDGSTLKRIQLLDKIHKTDFYKSLPEITGYF